VYYQSRKIASFSARLLGLDEETLDRGVSFLSEVLASKEPMTRHELAPYLTEAGVPTEGQALIYVINRAAWEGVLCLGPSVKGKQSYVHLDDWIGRNLKESDGGAALLAERYLSAYGPATPQDFSAWSGLPWKVAMEAWIQVGDKSIEVEYPSGRGSMLKRTADLEQTAQASSDVRLLPKFDTFLLGYNDRSLFLSPQHTKMVNAGGGILRPILLVDGRVQGIWKMGKEDGRIKIVVKPFSSLARTQLSLLESEVTGIGGFLEKETELEFAE
jgi:hypothetical protein